MQQQQRRDRWVRRIRKAGGRRKKNKKKEKEKKKYHMETFTNEFYRQPKSIDNNRRLFIEWRICDHNVNMVLITR